MPNTSSVETPHLEPMVNAKRAPAALLLSLMVVLLGYSHRAHASINFPVVLITDYGFQGSCDVCHVSLTGGAGTATKPFGQTVREQGIEGGASDAQLRAALAAIEARASDSDGDGFPDIQELSEAGDPNDAAVGPGGAAYEPVEFGCLTIAPPRSRHDALPALCALLVAMVLGRAAARRRRW